MQALLQLPKMQDKTFTLATRTRVKVRYFGGSIFELQTKAY